MILDGSKGQKSGAQPQFVQSLQSPICPSFLEQFSDLSMYSSGSFTWVASQMGGSFVYLQAHISYTDCVFGTTHLIGLNPVPLWDPEKTRAIKSGPNIILRKAKTYK